MSIIKEYLSKWSSEGTLTPIKISNPTTENFSVKFKEGSGIPETTIEIQAGGYTVLPYTIACYVAIEFGKKISYSKNSIQTKLQTTKAGQPISTSYIHCCPD